MSDNIEDIVFQRLTENISLLAPPQDAVSKIVRRFRIH